MIGEGTGACVDAFLAEVREVEVGTDLKSVPFSFRLLG